MKTRNKVVGATAAAGLLALAVNGTLALWSDRVAGNDILASTGHLDVSMSDAQVYDVSALCGPVIILDSAGDYFDWDDCAANEAPRLAYSGDASGAGPVGPVDIADFLLVPGDVIRVAAPIKVELSGQNIAARLDVDFDGTAAAVTDPDGDGNDEVTLVPGSYKLVKADNAADAIAASAGTGTDSYLFTADSSTGEEVWAVFDIAFDDEDVTGLGYGKTAGSAAADADLMLQVGTMEIVSAISAELTQVRS